MSVNLFRDRRKQRRFERLCRASFKRAGGVFAKLGTQPHLDAVYAVGTVGGAAAAPWITRYEAIENGPSAPRLARIIWAKLQNAIAVQRLNAGA